MVFERGALELDLGAKFFCHFADGRAEAPCPTIGDGMIQAAVASLATELIRGKTAEEALSLKTEELAGELGPLPPMMRCTCRYGRPPAC